MLRVGGLPLEYCDKLPVLHGEHLTRNEISEAIGLAASLFVFAALLETQEGNPVHWIQDQLEQLTLGTIIARAPALIVEAHRGEGLLFWLASSQVQHLEFA